MKLAPILLVLLALAGCGSTQSASQFGDVALLLPPTAGADDVGVYFAKTRTFDTGDGVNLLLSRDDDAQDFRITSTPPEGCITVMAIVPPDKLVLCVDEVILQDERQKVVAVVRGLMRGYEQAQLEPEEALSAMTSQVPDADATELATQLDDAIPAWTAGQPYFGAVTRGPGRDSSIASDARENRG